MHGRRLVFQLISSHRCYVLRFCPIVAVTWGDILKFVDDFCKRFRLLVRATQRTLSSVSSALK